MELMYFEDLDPRLNHAYDWQVVVAVAALGIDGIITNDDNFPQEPRVLPALKATGLSLIVVESLGHHSVRATGALLLDLPGIAKRIRSSGPAMFRLRHKVPEPTPIADALAKRALRLGKTVPELLREEGIRPDERRDPLA